jgi:protein SCO1/2
MATSIVRSLRLAEPSVCRQCATLQSRRTFASISQNPKREIRSRTTLNTTTPSQASSPWATLSKRGYKTVQEAKSRARSGVRSLLPFAPAAPQVEQSQKKTNTSASQPFSWQSGLLFLAAGAGLTFYFRYEKARMARARVAEANKGIGKPLVGGAFHLTDHHGRDFTQEDLKGKYSLVYFGFTHCPDICPEELDKMAGMIDAVKEKHGEGVMRNVFISCDPARDTPEVIRRYLAEFHEDILGMTGTWQEVKEVCKAYRVYFSTPADVQPGQDYLVDHSIYFYLMGEFPPSEGKRIFFTDAICTDPEGDFVEAIGRNFTVDAAAKVINDHISDWRGKIDRS